MVGNMNRKSKRIELSKEKKMLSKIKDIGDVLDLFKNVNRSRTPDVLDMFKNVWYYSSGILDEKVSRVLEVGQAKLCPYVSGLCGYYIIGKNPNNMEIEEAIGLHVPAVSQDWVIGSVECGKLLPAAAFSFSPSKDQLMSGVRVCISGVGRPDACSIWAMVKFNGGQVDTLLTEASTHLVATSDQGKLYEEALARNDVFVVTPDWVTDSIRRKIKCIENLYHPRLIDTSVIKLIDTPQLAPTDKHLSVVADYNPATPSKTSLDMKRRPNLACFANFFSTSSDKTEKMRKVEGSLKKLLPARRGRGCPKGSDSKHPLKKEKAKKSTQIKKSIFKRAFASKDANAKNPMGYPFRNSALLSSSDSVLSTIKSKTKPQKIKQHNTCNEANAKCFSVDQNQNKIMEVEEAKTRRPDKQIKLNLTTRQQVGSQHLNDQTVSLNPTTQPRMTRKHSNIETILANPGTRQLASQCPTKQIKFNPIIEQEVASPTHQIKINRITEKQGAKKSPNNHIVSDNQTSPELMAPSTIMRNNDSFQTSKGKEENQTKLISSVKRKLVKKENIGKVSKKLKWGKTSKLSEMSNSTEGYSCQMCDKAFRKRWNILEHIKTVHEGVRFPCPMCDLTASTKSNLRRHMATKHNLHMRNIVNDSVQVVDSVNEDVIEDTVTSHPNTISHDSFHTPQLPEEKQNVKHDLPLLDTIKSYQNPIVNLSPQLKSSNCTQHHVGNGLQGEDLKQQEYAPNQPSKHHQTVTNNQPALSLSMHNVLRHHAMLPLPKSKHLLASVPTASENIKEISPVVRSWTVEETITRVSLWDQKLAPHVQIFRSHEIDGRALLLLTPEMMVKYLDMKLGPALKVGSIIEKLKTK